MTKNFWLKLGMLIAFVAFTYGAAYLHIKFQLEDISNERKPNPMSTTETL